MFQFFLNEDNDIEIVQETYVYADENSNEAIKILTNGQIMMEEHFEIPFYNASDNVGTMVDWNGFYDCMGITGPTGIALSVICGGVCLGTLGAGCVFCVSAFLGISGSGIGVCLGNNW